MRIFPCVLLFAFVLSSCGSSKKNEASSADNLKPDESNHPLAITVNVDGSLKEWPEPLPGYSKETALHFGVTNNHDFLFIALACSEDQIQRKMLRTGMEVYISVNGKKETSAGIEFPYPSAKTNGEPMAGDPNNMVGQNVKDKSGHSEELDQLHTFGLKKSGDSTYPLSNDNHLKVAYTWGDNNFFNVEYAIPLKEIFTKAADARNSNIQVGFKLNGFGTKENSRQSGSYAGGGRGGGMRGGGMRGGGGTRGGGMRGGGMNQNGETSQGMNSNAEIAKDQSFWTKYLLSPGGK